MSTIYDQLAQERFAAYIATGFDEDRAEWAESCGTCGARLKSDGALSYCPLGCDGWDVA